MQRASRRRQKLQEKKQSVTYALSNQQLKGIRDNAYNEGYSDGVKHRNEMVTKGSQRALSQATLYLVGIASKVLTEQYSWNIERCNEFALQFLQEYNDDGLTLEKLESYPPKYCGLEMLLDEDEL